MNIRDEVSLFNLFEDTELINRMKGSRLMIQKFSTVITAAFLAAPMPVYADSNISEIETTIQKYLNGTQFGKPNLVAEAFTSSLEVQWLGEDDVLMRRPGPEYISRIEQDIEVPRYGRIVSLDTTDRSPMAKVEINWNNRLYTDYKLLKIEGEWKITNKIATWIEIDSVE